jgi:ribonuclease D
MSDNLVYIENQVALDNLSNHLKGVSKIAIDLEFDKNHYTYGFNICLIQLFDGTHCYLIDPLTIKSLASLFKVFEDPDVELITFAFGEDFRLLHHLGCSPTNIIDLSTVRSLLNRGQSSLTNVLIEELDIHSAKDFQRSNWCLRPLSEEQKIYAAEDVLFLFQLREKLMQELSDLDRLEWLEDEKKSLASSNGEVAPDFNSTYHKERKMMNLPQWERFKALVAFREKHSERLNKPTYKVIDRELLSDLAMKNDLSSWSSQKRIHPALKKEAVIREVQLVLDATNKEIADKGITDEHPARPQMSQIEKVSHSKKKWMIHQLSEEVLIPIKNVITEEYGEQLSTFILSKRMMEKIIEGEIVLPNYRLTIIKNAAQSLGIAEDKLNFLR